MMTIGAGGGNYQTLINQARRQLVDAPAEPIETTLRRVVREELRHLPPVRRRKKAGTSREGV